MFAFFGGGNSGGIPSLAADSDVSFANLAALDQMQYDGSHWINAKGGMVKLKTITPLVNAANLSFPAIPATYGSLILHIYARGDTANTASSLNVQFNADTSANYDYYYQENAAGAVAQLAQTLARIGTISAATSTANIFDTTILTIPNYAGSIGWKQFLASGTRMDTVASFAFSQMSGNYRSTSPIASIIVAPGTGNFIPGTVGVLYGLVK